MPEPILEAVDLTKVYGNGTVANKKVTLDIRAGEILGLVGENGAGKSTLMKILYGEEAPTSGTLRLGGRPVAFASIQDAIRAGIGMVHQHFMLVNNLTLAENLVLGHEPRRPGTGFFDLDAAVEQCETLAARYNLKVTARARVADVSVSMRQKVEILKALYRGAQVLILDEPTAVLTPQETEELFTELRQFRDQGHTIVFISHKLPEIFALCDRVAVMRDGRLVATHLIADIDHQSVSNEMVGREVQLTLSKAPAKPGPVVLTVNDLKYVDDFDLPVVNGIGFGLRAGEVLGVAAVDGNGQSELVQLITGLAKPLSGTIRVGGRNLTGASPAAYRKAGVAHVAEDRMTVGAALGASIEDNLLADRYRRFTTPLGFLRRRAMNAAARDLVTSFDIRCGSERQSVGSLSGGNMQKVVVGREFTADAQVLVVSQPTRGVDVGAIEFLHRRIVAMRDEGKAVLVVSSDLNEVLSLSDSLIVLHKGQVAAFFPDASLVTDRELGLYMLGLKRQTDDEIRRAFHE
jgi:ABC-type uncharacterized transport system ATPase subunit